MTTKIATIVLIKGDVTTTQLEILKNKNIILHRPEDTYENANDKSFNESKFFGDVCVSLHGNNIALPNAETYVNTKGNFGLVYTLGKRMKLPAKDIRFIVVCNTQIQAEKTNGLSGWILKNNAEIMNDDEFKECNIQPNKVNVELKVTCGLMCRSLNAQEKEPVVGHRTCAFGVTLNEACKLKEDNNEHMTQTYDGCNIMLTVDGKPGGSVIAIGSLGSTAHVTNNTIIKSVLSGQVVEKYNNNVMQFKLSQIDPSTKQDKNITIEKTADTKVEITGWYVYAIDL